eukprot:1160953-Pelagomonas_calceolata.AAC.2
MLVQRILVEAERQLGHLSRVGVVGVCAGISLQACCSQRSHGQAPPEEHADVEALVRRVMMAADKGQLSCPLVVDTAWGANWKEAE